MDVKLGTIEQKDCGEIKAEKHVCTTWFASNSLPSDQEAVAMTIMASL
jgi:hypothetical protein